jgi:hypothetical protein
MTNAWSWPGFVSVMLLATCTCACLRRVPRLSSMLLSEKTGALGALYKMSIVGTRLHWQVSLACALMAMYILLLK